MALYDKTVESHIEGLLGEGGNEFALASYMTRVTYDRNGGETAAQLQRYAPLRMIAINLRSVSGESAMYDTKTADTCVIEAFERTYPQVEVGIDRILDKHWYILARIFKHIGNLLHCERIGRRARTYPQQVYSIFKSRLDMTSVSHFGRHFHTGLLLYLIEPSKPRNTYTLEASRLGARLPYACTKYFYACTRKTAGCGQDLFFGLCAART